MQRQSGELRRHLERSRFNFGINHNLTHQAHGQCLLCCERFAAQEYVHGGKLANRTRQALCGTTARHDADLDLGLTKTCAVAGDNDVGMHGQFATAAQGMAAHCRDHGLATGADGTPKAVHLSPNDLCGRGIHIFVEIRSSAEGALAPCKDDGLDGRVGIQTGENLGQCTAQRQIQGIKHSRAVQAHQHHAWGRMLFKQGFVRCTHAVLTRWVP